MAHPNDTIQKARAAKLTPKRPWNRQRAADGSTPHYFILITGAVTPVAGSNNPNENTADADAIATYSLPSIE